MAKRKRAKITYGNETKIKEYALKHRTMKRTALAEKLQKEVKWDGPAPEVEVLERKISQYRNPLSLSSLDMPWGLASLADNPIPPEVLPKVLEIFVVKLLSEGVHLTIREAMWIARFASLPVYRENLYLIGIHYARSEAIADANNVDLCDPYTELVDDTLYYSSIGEVGENFFGKPLEPADLKELKFRIGEVWSRYKEYEKKLNKKELNKEVGK